MKGYRMPKPALCPAALWEVVLKCWEEKPEARPSFTDIYKHIFDLVGKNEQVKMKESFMVDDNYQITSMVATQQSIYN